MKEALLHKLLFTSLCLSPALLPVASGGTRIEFSIAEGTANSKVYRSAVDIEMDDLLVTMNGQEAPGMADAAASLSSSYEVTFGDQYISMGDSRPLKLKRLYDSLAWVTKLDMDLGLPGSYATEGTANNGSSKLEGSEVLFAWSEEDGRYLTSFFEDDGNEKLLAGLTEDMDLREFLPAGEVKAGDEWTVANTAMVSVLAPGGDLQFTPANLESEDVLDLYMGMGSFVEWYTKNLTGEVKARFAGERETEAGVRLAVIKLEVNITNALAFNLEGITKAIDEKVGGSGVAEFRSLALAFEVEGEATLLWDLDAGRAHSFELGADLTLEVDATLGLNPARGELEFDYEAELSGTLTTSLHTE